MEQLQGVFTNIALGGSKKRGTLLCHGPKEIVEPWLAKKHMSFHVAAAEGLVDDKWIAEQVRDYFIVHLPNDFDMTELNLCLIAPKYFGILMEANNLPGNID